MFDFPDESLSSFPFDFTLIIQIIRIIRDSNYIYDDFLCLTFPSLLLRSRFFIEVFTDVVFVRKTLTKNELTRSEINI